MNGEKILMVVTDPEAGVRLDALVAARLPGVSRSRVQKWIEAERVIVDGEARKARFTVSPGQQIEVSPLPPAPSEVIPQEIPLQILYEDEALLVIDKPAGLVVHPGAGNWEGTLANALVHYLGNVSRRDTLRPGIVHRLDKGTSGVLVVAKTESAHEILARQFAERSVEKMYLALLWGRLAPPTGLIDLAIGRDLRHPTRISARSRRPRTARTRYEVVRLWKEFSLVKAFPETGRTHQIRVHFHHLGNPVVGDETYSRGKHQNHEPAGARARRLGRLFLHAQRIGFRHPTTGEGLVFEAPLPRELAEFLDSLGE